MDKSRGEGDFVRLPGFAAKLYDSLMRSSATQQQYQEIAKDLVSGIGKGHLLDIGTGPGYLLLEVHKLKPEIELHGLDISPAMLEQANINLAGINVDLQLGTIESTSYTDAYFDTVTCSGSFYLWNNPGEGLEEIYRILKPSRSACLYETHRDYDEALLMDKMKVNLKGENLLRRLLAPRFFFKQLAMTYTQAEIEKIIEGTHFASNFSIEKVTIVDLPVWLRINLLDISETV
jgi:ubiquinone/menaquinone biosynthesis C-methylase UbiE